MVGEAGLDRGAVLAVAEVGQVSFCPQRAGIRIHESRLAGRAERGLKEHYASCSGDRFTNGCCPASHPPPELRAASRLKGNDGLTRGVQLKPRALLIITSNKGGIG